MMLDQYWPSVPHRADRARCAYRDSAAWSTTRRRSGADRIVNCLAGLSEVRHRRDRRRLPARRSASTSVSAKGRVPRRRDRTRRAGVVGCGGSAVGGAAPRRADPATVGGRQEHGGMHAGRRGVRIRRAGRRAGVARIREDIDGSAVTTSRWCATGTPPRWCCPTCTPSSDYDQHLTLDGLRLVFERNRDSQRGRLKQAR